MIKRTSAYRLQVKLPRWWGNVGGCFYRTLWQTELIDQLTLRAGSPWSDSTKYVVLRRRDSGYSAGIEMPLGWFVDRFRGETVSDVIKYLCSLTTKQWKLIKLEVKLYGND